MKIYVDSEYHCHTTNPDGTFREVEHPFFDGRCATFIEGYCYDDSKGYVQIYPWKNFDELDADQREYEKRLIAEYESALAAIEAALGV
jgi:hypothetical protein